MSSNTNTLRLFAILTLLGLFILLLRGVFSQNKPSDGTSRMLPAGVTLSAGVIFYAQILDATSRKSLQAYKDSERVALRVGIHNKNKEAVEFTMNQVAPDLFYITDESNSKLPTVPSSDPAGDYDLKGRIIISANARIELLLQPFRHYTDVHFNKKGIYFLRHETYKDIKICFELDGAGGITIIDRKQ
jgi:hypothetical protein